MKQKDFSHIRVWGRVTSMKRKDFTHLRDWGRVTSMKQKDFTHIRVWRRATTMKQKDFSGASLVSDHIRVWQLATSMKQKIAVSSMGNRPSAEFFVPIGLSPEAAAGSSVRLPLWSGHPAEETTVAQVGLFANVPDQAGSPSS